ncbi:MAG: MauE/DoxX family redox-associated membrane protein [Lentimicrobiaceae bacterium]|jgi:uncharacterized membrane protein YphA (DoxX/SURF4 family)
MFEKKVLNIYSIIIGVLFIVSGAGKLIDTTGFSNLIYQYGLGYLMILAPLIVLIEILLGLFLLLLISPKRVAMISSLLLIIFTISFAYAHFANGVNDCGCFGSVQHTNLPPIFSFIRNIILIIMALIVWIKYPIEKIEIKRWKTYLIFSVISISLFTAGLTFHMPNVFNNKKESSKFQNQNIKNTELSKYIKTSPDSTYLILCFSYDCPHCWNSIANFKEYKKSNTVDRILSLGTGTDSTRITFNQAFQPDFVLKNLSFEAMNKITDVYPTAYYIQNDTVKVVIKGELPSFVTFNNQSKLALSK